MRKRESHWKEGSKCHIHLNFTGSIRAKRRADSGAGRWLKDEGRVGRDRPPGAAVQLDLAGDKAAAAVGKTCGKATQRGTSRCPASDQHQEPDSRRTERTKKLAPQLKQARVWTKARNCLMTGSKTAGAIVST